VGTRGVKVEGGGVDASAFTGGRWRTTRGLWCLAWAARRSPARAR